MKTLVNTDAAKSELNTVTKSIAGVNSLIKLIHSYTGTNVAPDDILNAVRNEKHTNGYIFNRILKLSENSFAGTEIDKQDYPIIKDKIDTSLRSIRISSEFDDLVYQSNNELFLEPDAQQKVNSKHTLKLDPVLDKYQMAVKLATVLNESRELIEMNQNRPLPAGLKVNAGVYSVNDEFFIEILK
ncbi:MAG: hypothetical protein RQ743_13965 [Bacteroidales bacterium]|nr:hypothetical protein [Bacteroidales bacterium]MDT8402789.1 hypothetical protein [Bacteroidales bacterium]